jgi:pimeloyl-ACP methyl ester carboxylesterase
MAAHADDLVRVLDGFGVARCTVAGWSLGGFIAASVAARHPDRFDGVVMVDGGIAHELPPGVDADEIVDRFVEPAVAQLTATYPSVDAYIDYWRKHPSFAETGMWNEHIERQLRAALEGTEPALRARTRLDAMRTDVADTVLDPQTRRAAFELEPPTVFIRAGRGLLNEPEGYYSATGFEDTLAEHDIELVDRPEDNHFTLMFSDDGATVVANAIRSMSPNVCSLHGGIKGVH